MKYYHCILLYVTICLLAFAYSTQLYTYDELYARNAIEADEHLSANDVITQQDFTDEEFQSLQSISNDDFWNTLEAELAVSHDSLLTELNDNNHAFVDAEPAKAEAKPSNPANTNDKASSSSNFLIISDKDLEIAAKSGKTPVEGKQPILPDADYNEDSPYEFLYADDVIPTPEGTDAMIAKASKNAKKIEKNLLKEGHKLFEELIRLEKIIKRNVDDEDWSEVRKNQKQLNLLAKKIKSWKLRKDANDQLKASSELIIDWEAHHNAVQERLRQRYVQERVNKTHEIRKVADELIQNVKIDDLKKLKAKALIALRRDLSSLQGRAMHNFALKLKSALYKKFGQAAVDAAVAKGGLAELKKVTGDKAGDVLLLVASHLPTVGPYVRAGLVGSKVGNPAFRLVRRWN